MREALGSIPSVSIIYVCIFVITDQHGQFFANDTLKTPLPFWDSSIRPRPTKKRLRSEMVVPNLKKNEKKRLRSEMVVPNLKKMKKTTLDSRDIVCVRERTAKPAFSSNGNV